MSGPWEKYQKQQAEEGPWTKYQAKPEDLRPKTAIGESALAGLAQGASLGWADEATAGIGALKDWAAGKLGMRGDIGLADAYGTYIDKIRAKDDAAKKDNPKAFTTGAIVGGIGSAVVPGALSAKAGAAMNTVKGGAAIGALTGAGTSEASLTKSPDSLIDFTKDTLSGAALGGATAYGAKLLGKAVNALKPSELNKLANIKTLKAAGYMGPDFKKLSEAEKQAIGQTLWDKGVVRLGDSLDDVLEKAQAAKGEAGEAIGEALSKVDDLVKSAKDAIDAGSLGGQMPQAGKDALKASIDKQFQFNMQRIGKRIHSELIEPNANNPLLKGELNKLSSIADDFLGNGSVSLKQGNVIKGTQGKVTNFNSDTVPQSFKRELYDIIKTEIDDIVGRTGNLESGVSKIKGGTLPSGQTIAQRNASIADDFAKAKSDYSALKRTTDVAEKRLGQVQANREISLTDTIAGVGGLATGNPANAIALGALNKLARQYGDSAIASGARAISNIISKTPEKLGQFGEVLALASKRGLPAIQSTHLALMKNPDYQRIIAEYEKSQSPVGRRLNKIQRLGE